MQSLTSPADTQALAIKQSTNLPTSLETCVPDYALLYFDHLYSEYLTLEPMIDDQNMREFFKSVHLKRLKSELTWSDIYSFDLGLVGLRPLENLIRKAYDVRAKYRSIAGPKEFDEYLASKPPDLTTILIAPPTNGQPVPPPASASTALAPAPDGPPPQPAQPAHPESNPMPESAEIMLRVLRADVRYLLGKFYLYYAMLPMRENLREHLTTRAVRLTKWILVAIMIFMALSFGGGQLFSGTFAQYLGAFGPIIGSVAFAGIVGGCVSMLQRIQSSPTEGDALFNLAALTNGWRGLSLSPLYGGIFASLLFILFAAGILQGSVFPKIETLKKPAEAVQSATENEATPVEESTTASTDVPKQQKPDPNVARLPAAADNQVLRIKDFLTHTGPSDGVSFALLLIWSFVAGFAERLVPDTLNRLVAKTEALQGTNG